jgi:hypothetical protein
MLRDDCALNLWRIQIAPKPQACPRYHRFPKVAWSRPRPLRGSFERLVDANKIIIQEMQLCLLKTSSAAEILVRYRMRRITIKRARTWHYRKMRPCIEQSNGLASLSPFPSWPDCIISTSGYDFRKGQRWWCWHRRNTTQLLTGRARMAGQVNKQEDRHVEGSKRK